MCGCSIKHPDFSINRSFVATFFSQIARLKGCRVVGIAGSQHKCAWLTGEAVSAACYEGTQIAGFRYTHLLNRLIQRMSDLGHKPTSITRLQMVRYSA